MAINKPNVFGLLNKLDMGKTMGPDEMHSTLLNEQANTITSSLRMFFQLPRNRR